MKKTVAKLALCVSLGLAAVTTPAVGQVRSGINLPLFPQVRDYANSCRPSNALERDPYNLTAWRGEVLNLPADQLLAVAELYAKGSGATAPNADLALRMLRYLADRPSPVQLRAKYLAAVQILDRAGAPDQDRYAAQLLADAAAARVGGAARELGVLYESGRGAPQDFEMAARYYRTAASEGDADSAFALARLYYEGLVRAPSATAADDMSKLGLITLLTDVNQGKCSALITVASLYEAGDLIAPNDAAAAAWYEAAASAGNPRAMNAIARRYYGGIGVNPSTELALEWWRRAAALGSADAKGNIGMLFATGDGVDANFNEAIRWLGEAADAGNVASMQTLASLYRGELRALPAAQRDPEQAFLWTKRAYEFDPTRVSNIMAYARALSAGDGTMPDADQAFALFNQAMRLGNRSALREMATAYLTGDGAQRDPARALQIFRQAAARGDLVAYRILIDMYRCGIGTDPNAALADLWLERAAAMGDLDSLIILSNRNLGEVSLAEQERRLQLLMKAAAGDSREAMLRLSEAFRTGDGVQPDPANSERWLALALRPGPGQAEGEYLLAEAYRTVEEYTWDPVRVEQLLTSSHEKGYQKATVRLGKYHIRPGDDGMDNIQLGVQYLEQAASAGSADAMRELALYYRGSGQLNEAVGWLDNAIASGLLTARVVKAEWAYQGVLTGQPEPVMAGQLIDETIERGPCSIPDFAAIATAFARGQAGEARVEESLDWIQKAIDNFRPNPDDVSRLGVAALQGAPHEGLVSYGIALLERSIEMGSVRGYLELARVYLDGLGGEINYPRAMEYFERAVQAGETRALVFIGRAKAEGLSGQVDTVGAWEAMERAAALGLPEAFREMGHWYLRGMGRPENIEEGLRLLEQASRQGDVDAMLDMANIYSVGLVTDPRPDIAIRWLESAATAGNTVAMHRLGLAYLLGLGVDQSENEAQRWFRLSGNAGYSIGGPSQPTAAN
ncbi:MAG TPA: tetratricopeptide repeat protein [Paracoccaceae bacterium]|nr:tetratricopeptide repeat protein [Paracoccaceae bacterium]